MARSSVCIQLPALYFVSLPPVPMFWGAGYLAVGNKEIVFGMTALRKLSQAAQVGF